jgi:phosphoglycerate dehydrogenase-like enzyme
MTEFKILITDGLDESGQAILRASATATAHMRAQTIEAKARAAADIAEEILNALQGKSLCWKVA